MKRYSLIGLLTVLVAVTVWAAIIEVPEAPARMTAVVAGAGGGTAPASPCPSGYATKVLSWNGDYTADTDAACNAAGTKVDGTLTGATVGADYGETGNGLLLDVADEYLQWPWAWANDDVGTLSVRVNMATATATCYFIEAYGDADDRFLVRTYGGFPNPTLRATHQRGGATACQVTTTNGIPADTWTTIQVAWDFSAATERCAVKIGDNAWETTTTTASTWGTTPTVIQLGEGSSGAWTAGDVIWMDNFSMRTTYGPDE